MSFSNKTKKLIHEALREDLGRGDVTTRALIPSGLDGAGVIIAKAGGIFCGAEAAQEVFRAADAELKIRLKARDGRKVAPGQTLVLVSGRVASILSAERTALNFIGHLSGIATLTRRFREQVKGTRAKILDTRKTTPLWRELEKYAVRAGGGENHRFGLWDEALVKDNHLWALRALGASRRRPIFLEQLRGALHKFEVPTEVEVRSLKELEEMLAANIFPTRFLLDHFSVPDLKEAVKLIPRFFKRKSARKVKKPLLEASGNIHLGNVRAIARSGVDRISVGAITHSAPAMDISLKLTAL